MWKVEYEATDVFVPGPPVTIFEAPRGWSGSAEFAEPYEIATDDQRFLIPVSVASSGAEEDPRVRVVLVNNFVEELKRRVPD
jgi:hypothetical protein